jgi:hypothetical protein
MCGCTVQTDSLAPLIMFSRMIQYNAAKFLDKPISYNYYYGYILNCCDLIIRKSPGDTVFHTKLTEAAWLHWRSFSSVKWNLWLFSRHTQKGMTDACRSCIVMLKHLTKSFITLDISYFVTLAFIWLVTANTDLFPYLQIYILDSPNYNIPH